MDKTQLFLKNKKGVFLGVAAIAALIPVLFFLVIVLGIPLTGLTIFLVQNGKLIAIVVGIFLVFKLVTSKK